MKQLSASIIVLAAAILITGGSHVQHSDTQLFLQVVGCGVGLIGLGGWFICFKEKYSYRISRLGHPVPSTPLLS